LADHFVIDGSNLATEGRTEPSLAQLKEAVAAFHSEHPGAVATVVVDASFEHRIDPAERAAFAKTESAGEVVSPPAGAVGRGDGFLLQIADRTGGTVISNDSFQEFHAEYEWLFEPGRLIGGKPVPGVGWIFSLRRPVRGIVSRKTVQKAKQEGKAEKQVQKAIAEATASAMQPDAPKRRRRRGGRGRSTTDKDDNKAEPEAVNEPASFLQFVIDHRLGTEVEGTVEAFASHGAFVSVDGVRCYVPLSAMGSPQPSRARDVLTKDETRSFVVQAVDAPRRGIELGLPGFATVAGAPSDETVEAEVRTQSQTKKDATKKDAAKKDATKKDATKKGPAKKGPAKKGDGRKDDAKQRDTKRGDAKQQVAKQEVAKKQVAKQEVAKKQVAKQAVAKKEVAKQEVARPAEPTRQPAKQVATKKTAKPAPGRKAVAKQPAPPAPAKKKAAAKPAAAKPAAKQAPLKKTAAKKSAKPAPTKKAAAKQAPAKPATPPLSKAARRRR
jgi:Histone H1-like nucleoprotein HC2/Zc3h12a-like Ribonuclease NYN domain/S1 RNA binding domain